MRTILFLIASMIRLSSYSTPPGTDKQLTVSRLFSDHMVLQQKTKVNIWGWASPGQKVVITGSWKSQASAIANTDCKWMAKLATPGAGGPYNVTIKTLDSRIDIKDVLIGEVWLASGQSNMDIPLKGWPPGDSIFNSKQEINDACYPGIRLIKIPFAISPVPLDSTGGKWMVTSPATAGDFSATAYFYARALYRKLQVPIGIIQSSIGGTPAEAWTSQKSLRKMGDFNQVLDEQEQKQGRPDAPKLNSNSPTVLFNAMIHPLIPYSIKGIIWYQGESNVGRAEQYQRLFPLLIRDWRKQWGSKLPFYYVQLAPHIYKAADQHEQSMKLRDAQRYGLRLPRTGMVSTLDIGYLPTAHPPYKQQVGERLARFAFKNDYGEKELVASGPVFEKATVSVDHLIIKFRSTGSGLTAPSGRLDNFEIAGADKRYVKAEAKIKIDKIIVSSAAVPSPRYVRYAWSDSSTASLFNKEGLPAATFSSEQE